MRLLGRLLMAGLVGIALVSVAVAAWLFAAGLSAQPEPSTLETVVARKLRLWMIPAEANRRPNPVPTTSDEIAAGLEHFADHCAICHANDGSGRVEIGENLFPRAPDLRAADTQSLSDGALFYIIEEGVRFTGMPGWKTGTPEGERASWHLVNFIRHLPDLTDEERRRMERLNPRSAEEWREEQEVEEFLEGGSGTSDAPHRHDGGQQ
jgi:mono/diheme cytochrome c family protein